MSIEDSVLGLLAPVVDPPTSSTSTDKRGRKPGSKVKVKNGVVKVNRTRKQKQSHGWFFQGGFSLDGKTIWDTERALGANSVKTAVREARDLVSTFISTTSPKAGETYAARVFEVKYQNLDVKLVPQKPKLVL